MSHGAAKYRRKREVLASLMTVTAGNVARTAIEKVPLLAALLPQLQTAHSAIFAVRAQAEDPKVQRLSQQEAEVDAKHDALVRGIYGSLSMLAQVSANADELLRLRDLLFPEGAAEKTADGRGRKSPDAPPAPAPTPAAKTTP
jgi:hypothetical protein